jgi:hypothetical protein
MPVLTAPARIELHHLESVLASGLVTAALEKKAVVATPPVLSSQIWVALSEIAWAGP